jgi:hypothetical protein
MNLDIGSLVVTGYETAVVLFTQINYGGLSLCVQVPSQPNSIAEYIFDVPERTGLPIDAFKSFRFTDSCLAEASILRQQDIHP